MATPSPTPAPAGSGKKMGPKIATGAALLLSLAFLLWMVDWSPEYEEVGTADTSSIARAESEPCIPSKAHMVCEFDTSRIILMGSTEKHLWLDPGPKDGRYTVMTASGQLWTEGMNPRSSTYTLTSPSGHRSVVMWLTD